MQTPAAPRVALASLLLALAACGGAGPGPGPGPDSGAGPGAPPLASAPPVVTALDVHGAPPAGGTPVVITGTGFQPGVDVTFGGTAATGVTLDPSTDTVRCTTPPLAAGTYDVVVTNPDGQSSTFPGFHYGPPPAPVSFFPGSGGVGTSFTVLGNDLVPGTAGASEVLVGGVRATIVSSILQGHAATSLLEDIAIVPTLAPGSYEVVVVNPDGQRGLAPGLFVVTGP